MKIISKNALSSSTTVTKNGIIKAKNQFMKQLNLVKKVKYTKGPTEKFGALKKYGKPRISKAKGLFMKELNLVQNVKTGKIGSTELRLKKIDTNFNSVHDKSDLKQSVIKQDKEKGRKVTISDVKDRCTCTGPDCNKLTDEMRERINTNFRKLSKTDKQKFVWQHVDVKKVGKGSPGRYSQENRNTYHLTIDGLNLTVCRRMFVRTTGVCEWTIRNWLKQNRLLQKVPLPEVIVKEEMTQDVKVLMKKLQKFLEDNNPFKNISPEVKTVADQVNRVREE